MEEIIQEKGRDKKAVIPILQAIQDSYNYLPEDVLMMPKSAMWRLLKPFTNRSGMKWINRLKYLSGATLGEGAVYRQTFAEFSFLLDYVPNWKRIYRPGGLIQHQRRSTGSGEPAIIIISASDPVSGRGSGT